MMRIAISEDKKRVKNRAVWLKAGIPLGEIVRAMRNLSKLRMRVSSFMSEVNRSSDGFGSSITIYFSAAINVKNRSDCTS